MRHRLYPEYRASGVESLGEVPLHSEMRKANPRHFRPNTVDSWPRGRIPSVEVSHSAAFMVNADVAKNVGSY